MAEQTNTYPRFSEKAWWAVREKFKSSLPAAISTNYFKTLLSLGSDASAKNNIIVPMKQLGLIDDELKTTQLANNWRLDDKYKEVCDIIIKNVYPPELMDLFPEQDVDKNSVKSWFMSHGVGESAAGQMAAMFLLLKDGVLKDSKRVQTKSSAKSTAKVTKASESGSNQKSENINLASNDLPPPPNNGKLTAEKTRPNLHIDLQIHISPDSTPEQIETIFSSMARHLYGDRTV